MRTDVSTSASPMQVTNYGLAGMLPIHSLNIYEILSVYNLTAKIGRKILKQVEYESARRKRIINEKTRKRDEEGSTFLLCTFIFFYLVENGSKKLILRSIPKAL